jgi:hypothetical protein
MTNYCMKLILDRWINPHIDTSGWEYFDLSCKSRDDTEDKVRSHTKFPARFLANDASHHFTAWIQHWFCSHA